MSGRVHQNDAPALSLASNIAAGDTTIPVNESISSVETPISYVINSGGANEEIVTLVDKNTGTSPSQFENCVRGCDGTSDQSHSSGETLTHEATARDFVDQDVAYSNILKPKSNLVAYDNFNRSDRDLDGDRLPSGQSWTDTIPGDWVIRDGRARNIGFETAKLTIPEASNRIYQRMFTANSGRSSDRAINFIMAWQDSNNYIRTKGGRDVDIEIKYQGSFSTLLSSGTSDFDRWMNVGYMSCAVTRIGTEAKLELNRAGRHVYIVVDESNDPNVFSILDNQTRIGFENQQDALVENYLAYRQSQP